MSGEGGEHGADQAPRWELLADYASGALDGTPEAARVAARIAADPAWATAHRELLAADARIRAELTALGPLDAGEAAPADLFDRLAAALAASTGPAEPAESDRAAGEKTGSGGSDLAEVRSLDDARRRRYRRLSAAAAVVVVLAGLGGLIGLVSTRTPVTNGSGSAVDSGPRAASPSGSQQPMGPHLDSKSVPGASGSGDAPLAGAARSVQLEATGTDYQPATLATVLHTVSTASRPDGEPSLPAGSAARVPAGLTRLTGGDALTACLGALSGKFAAEPVLVDYARFRGADALVTVIPTAVASNPWLVVAGPECGSGTPDVRYQRRAS